MPVRMATLHISVIIWTHCLYAFQSPLDMQHVLPAIHHPVSLRCNVNKTVIEWMHSPALMSI